MLPLLVQTCRAPPDLQPLLAWRRPEQQAETRAALIVEAAVAATGAGEAAGVEEESIYCNICKARRKLIFANGKRGRAVCCTPPVKRRRLTHKQPDTVGAYTDTGASGATMNSGISTEIVSREDAKGHVLLVADGLTWCWRCRAYSSSRIHGLNFACMGAPRPGQGYRLSRLKRSRHPLTNEPFNQQVTRLRLS